MPFLNRSINLNSRSDLTLSAAKQEPLDSSILESDNSDQSKQVIEGKWSEEQNLRFVIFVSYYSDIFSCKHKRKASKIFKIMQHHLQDRTAAQCRSHFQKILLKFKTVAKFKKFYEVRIGKQVLQQELTKFKTSWEQTHPPHGSKDQSIRQYREFGIQTDQYPPTKTDQQLYNSCSLLTSTQFCNGRLAQPHVNYYYYWHQLNQQYMSHLYLQSSMQRQLLN